MTIETVDALELLHSLRWDVDSLVENPFGEVVWLKPCIQNGVRVGITDCCFAEEPCPHHKQLGLHRQLAGVPVSP